MRLKNIIKRLNSDERGLASFVVVAVLVVLLTLISIGFAKIMDRAQNNALNNQLSSAANYAAQSALKDASATIVSQIKAGNTAPSSNTCIPPSGSPLKDVYDSGNLSQATDAAPTDRTASYTCILVDPKPTSLDYQQVPADNSGIVKILPEFTDVKVDNILFGWQASAGTGNNTPPPPANTGKFFNMKTWNNNKYEPILRVTLYPVDASDNLMPNYTYFFYPTDQNGTPALFTPYNSNGAILSARCGQNTPLAGFQGN